MKQSTGSNEIWKLGEKIRQLRRERNLSQEDLANICEFDRTYISLVERGKRNISFSNLCALARGLKVSVSELTTDI
jgi:transcriptional regulator with XRE-family HTH domain